MKLRILSITNKPAAWLHQGVSHFMTKFPPGLRPELVEISSKKSIRGVKSKLSDERDRIKNRLNPGSVLIVLDERGDSITSSELAKKLDSWMLDDRSVDFIVGGTEGLHVSLKAEANELFSLSRLTLPHQMARLFLIEALYRASTILFNHPYHRS